MATTAFENFTSHEPPRLDTASIFDLTQHATRGASAHAGAERHQPAPGDKHLPGGFSIGGADSAKMTPGDHAFSTVVDGSTRHFEIHVPPGYDGKKPIPVMMMMPGMGGSIEQLKHESGMNRAADQRGFAVVYTEALPKPFPGSFGLSKTNGWNLDHGSLTDKTAGYNDMDYIKQVNNIVSRDLNVDPAAKYIVGFSEGGGAAQYVAESMPHTFAGVGSVHGTHLDSDPKPQYGDKTAFVAVLGDDDHMLPVDGGRGLATLTMERVAGSKPRAQANVWAAADGLGMPTSVSDDGKDQITQYRGQGTEVTQIIRHGGEHAWDGLGQNPLTQITKKPDFGWPVIGMPNPKEDTTRDVINALMPFRKDGKHVDMERNFLQQ